MMGFFAVEGARLYTKDLKNAEFQLFETGHFALEEDLEEMASLIRDFLGRTSAMILTGEGHQAMVDRPLAALGLKRGVALSIPFFIPAVFAIAHTDLVLTVPRALAKIAVPQAK